MAYYEYAVSLLQQTTVRTRIVMNEKFQFLRPRRLINISAMFIHIHMHVYDALFG